MPLPKDWNERLTVPVIAAPMFMVSCPDLVVACCSAGVIGSFPALNQRSPEGYEAWLVEIEERLQRLADNGGKPLAPFAVNLSVRRNNPRLDADLTITFKHKVPFVITSLGPAKDVVDAVHGYGGVVFHDVTTLRHAEKALAAGVDGLIAVCAGAGGHGGSLNPFAFVAELRRIFDGPIALAGAVTNGAQVAAARIIGADLVSMGTRFIATREGAAPDAYKQMILSATAADIVYTPRMTGVPANFMAGSLQNWGLDPQNLDAGDIDAAARAVHFDGRTGKVWRDIWSAGQGVGVIDDIPDAVTLCRRLTAEYNAALTALKSRQD